MYRAPLNQIICLLLGPLRPRPSDLVVCGVAGGGGGGGSDGMGGVGGVGGVDVVDGAVVVGGCCVVEQLLGIVALRYGRC